MIHVIYSVVADQYSYTILWHWEYRGCVKCQGQIVKRDQGLTILSAIEQRSRSSFNNLPGYVCI